MISKYLKSQHPDAINCLIKAKLLNPKKAANLSQWQIDNLKSNAMINMLIFRLVKIDVVINLDTEQRVKFEHKNIYKLIIKKILNFHDIFKLNQIQLSSLLLPQIYNYLLEATKRDVAVILDEIKKFPSIYFLIERKKINIEDIIGLNTSDKNKLKNEFVYGLIIADILNIKVIMKLSPKELGAVSSHTSYYLLATRRATLRQILRHKEQINYRMHKYTNIYDLILLGRVSFEKIMDADELHLNVLDYPNVVTLVFKRIADCQDILNIGAEKIRRLSEQAHIFFSKEICVLIEFEILHLNRILHMNTEEIRKLISPVFFEKLKKREISVAEVLNATQSLTPAVTETGAHIFRGINRRGFMEGRVSRRDYRRPQC